MERSSAGNDRVMRALLLNCTLKPSPATSNTQALADVVVRALEDAGVETEVVRVVDRRIPPGVETEPGRRGYGAPRPSAPVPT